MKCLRRYSRGPWINPPPPPPVLDVRNHEDLQIRSLLKVNTLRGSCRYFGHKTDGRMDHDQAVSIPKRSSYHRPLLNDSDFCASSSSGWVFYCPRTWSDSVITLVLLLLYGTLIKAWDSWQSNVYDFLCPMDCCTDRDGLASEFRPAPSLKST